MYIGITTVGNNTFDIEGCVNVSSMNPSKVVGKFSTAVHSFNHLFFIYLFTVIGLLPGGSGYFTCKQNMELVTTRFKSGGLHEKHVVATWNVGNHLSICF